MPQITSKEIQNTFFVSHIGAKKQEFYDFYTGIIATNDIQGQFTTFKISHEMVNLYTVTPFCASLRVKMIYSKPIFK